MLLPVLEFKKDSGWLDYFVLYNYIIHVCIFCF